MAIGLFPFRVRRGNQSIVKKVFHGMQKNILFISKIAAPQNAKLLNRRGNPFGSPAAPSIHHINRLPFNKGFQIIHGNIHEPLAAFF
jgi:hypothetical protein